MDKINKALFKLSDAERKKLMSSFDKVIRGQTQGLQIKKLKGHKNLYRLRVGDNRMIYKTKPSQKPVVVYVGKRDDQTYRDF